MAKKNPEEIAALQKAAAEKKEADRVAAEQKAAADNVEAERVAAEQKAEAERVAAEERAVLIKKLTELEFPTNLDNLSNEELKQALDAYNLVANTGEQAGAQVAQIVTAAITEQTSAASATWLGKPIENKLQNISDVANKEKIPALWIRSVPESFMRCGRRFTREGYGIALDVLTEEEIQRLKDEPNLIVEEVEALVD